MSLRRIRIGSTLVALSLVAVACAGDGGGVEGTAAPPSTLSASAPSEPQSVPEAEPGLGAGSGWSLITIGDGIKPVLALDPDGLPAVAYLVERVGNGFVAFASAAEDWTVDEFVEGYFYGPIGLDFDPEGRPSVVWHDHQADQFDDQLGDLAYAVRDGGAWTTEAAEDDGHDGWDSVVVVGEDGTVHAAGVDPQQFGREDGVEYYVRRDGGWEVASIGTGPVEYEWNVALALDASGQPALSYFDNNTSELRLARFNEPVWTIETVASGADLGRFSSLAFDDAGRAHLSFFEVTGASTGVVRYAVETPDGWQVEAVAELDDVELGFTGARRVTALALTTGEEPVVAFSDRSGVWVASRDGSAWQVDTVATAGDRPFGQLVSLALDGADRPHLAFYEVTGRDPLSGMVIYATPS
jgi:hypothetical protein